MSGHSHWAGIKHKKALIDKKRGKIWSKLARNIIIAARAGGGDPDANLSLRYAIEKAKDANMPNDTIKRAIQRGTGEIEGAQYEEITYEGYGIGGVAIMVPCLTDNRNRTGGEIRNIFEKHGGSLGGTGSVAWMFKQKGLITVSAEDTTEDKLMEIVLDAGAEDITQESDVFEILCEPAEFEAVKNSLKNANIEMQVNELTMIPDNTVKLEGEKAKKILNLMEALEDNEDTQNVYANFDIPEETFGEAEG